MYLFRHLLSYAVAACLGVVTATAAEKESRTISASALAERLNLDREPGTTYVRLRLSTDGSVLQLQIKERRTQERTDMVYQVLFPKERKGEALHLRKTSGSAATGLLFEPPDTTRELKSSDMSKSLFESALTYEDVIENFFAWKNQEIVGNDEINRVKCVILESKPAKSQRSSYGKVRTWVDTRRMVPLRVEKYLPSGKLARRIDTTRVVSGPGGRPIPANLTIRAGEDGPVTELDGSRIKHDVVFSDEEFTPEGLSILKAPQGAPE